MSILFATIFKIFLENDPKTLDKCWSGTTLVSTNEGSKGLEFIETENPDMVILDIGMPDMDGFQVLREIRLFSQVSVIMLTVRGEATDIAKCLELGADDYIVKPFSHIELMARVQAVLRRVQGLSVATEERPFVSGKLSGRLRQQ